MTGGTAIEAIGGVKIDYNAVLRTLKLNPSDPNTQALLVTCQAYELDPVLKHMVLIQGAPYVTHKGLWHIAHRSGLLDGHEIVEEGESNGEWFARVAIYRKDWSRPVTMKGRYPKGGTNKQYGQEMAVTRAECLVLRRLFDVALPVYEEINWRDRPARADEDTPPPEPQRELPLPPVPIDATTGEIIEVPSQQQQVKQREFPAPGQPKVADAPPADAFTEADATLASPVEVRELLKSYGALTPEQKALVTLPLPASTRSRVSKDDLAALVAQVAVAGAQTGDGQTAWDREEAASA